MQLLPSDPDVETIISRIKQGDIDLQPDFQRGEVWTDTKKQRLIDSVLRNWHIPPIHLVQLKDSSKQQVLDGQQRLVAIRDFVRNKFAINGQIPPYDSQIEALDGLNYDELPPEWKRKFNQFTIRVFRITDYLPEEPGELFYRLNQLTNLTAAEQRNAFYGPARQQVKDLVEALETHGIDKAFLGFSNSRMAYDDVLARVCETLEAGTLAEKLTAGTLTNRYRSALAFSQATTENCTEAVRLLGKAKPFLAGPTRFNKATLYTWLVFLVGARTLKPLPEQIGKFLSFFETQRQTDPTSLKTLHIGSLAEIEPPALLLLLSTYEDRSTARVADVSSVILRDMVLWVMFFAFLSSQGAELPPDHKRYAIIREHIPAKLTAVTVDNFADDVTDPLIWGALP